MEMNNMRKNFAFALAGAAILVIALLVFLNPGESVTAAPFAAPPTPVAGITDKVSNDPGFIIYRTPFSITADTRYCPGDTSRFDTLDIEYAINQGVVNTVTIKTQYSNRLERFTDGANVVAANNADTVAMVQMPAFGRFTCLFVDVANSNSLSLTLTAVGK